MRAKDKEEDGEKKNKNSLEQNASSETPENENNVEAKNAKSKKNDSEEGDDNTDTTDDENAGKEDDKKEEDDKQKSKNSLSLEELSANFQELSSNFEKLNNMYTALVEENKSLSQFKANVEEQAKLAKVKEFYMLSEEDTKDIRENLSKYSVTDIEEKLAAVCYRKKINFGETASKEVTPQEEQPATTYQLDNHEVETIPAWLKAVENTSKRHS